MTSIAELTSIELQRVAWLDARNQNPHWSFVEFICGYFDDCSLTEGYSKLINNSFVSQGEYDVLHDWHNALDDHSSSVHDQYDHEQMLNDPKWLRIVDTGNKARRQLELLLSNEEKSILLEAMKYPGPSQWP
ncbi:MAG: hypothetical protein ABIQ75_10040 [Flavobacteriales bacterium]